MMFTGTQFDWSSSENHAFLNPRFPQNQAQSLLDALAQSNHGLKGHLFLLSSGTTASSFLDLRWIALSKDAFLASAAAVNRHLESTAQDVWLQPLPEFHVGGLSIWARSALSGAKVIPFPRWNAEAFMQTSRENQVTLTALVPTQVYDLVQEGYSCPESFRAIGVGGGAISPSLYEKALRLGWPLLPCYGMTETCSQIATASLLSLTRTPSERTSIPELTLLSHFDAKVQEDGRLKLWGESLLSGVIEQKEGRGVFRDPKTDGGYLAQDKGEVFGRTLRLLGRVGDFVKIGGESVEVDRLRGILERIRLEKKIRKDLALLAVPDSRLGYVIHLFIENGITDTDLNQLIAEFNLNVLGFEKIRKSHRVDQIPRTALGKLIPSQLLGGLSCQSGT